MDAIPFAPRRRFFFPAPASAPARFRSASEKKAGIKKRTFALP